jgi:hypothetical protein
MIGVAEKATVFTHRRAAAVGPHLMRRTWIVREFHLIKRGINHVLLIDDWAGGVF